jgi:hypothetical protein
MRSARMGGNESQVASWTVDSVSERSISDAPFGGICHQRKKPWIGHFPCRSEAAVEAAVAEALKQFLLLE